MNEEINKVIKDTVKKQTEIVDLVGHIVNNKTQLEYLINNISELTKSIYKIWSEEYEKIIFKAKDAFSSLNFDKIDKDIKDRCVFLVENGFYTYSRMPCYFEKNIDSVCEMIEIDVLNDKNYMYKILPEYKKNITEIYGLFKQHRYRLCILSLINIISIIFNSNFNNLDFTEINVDKLKEFKILNDSNQEYFVFLPYVIDANANKKNYKNKILVCSRENKYKDIPYNRNAILHGYSRDFGNIENCLRWFTVLFNTVDILEINNKIKAGVDNEIKI